MGTVWAPLEAEVIVIPDPAMRYEVPSVKRVRDPLSPCMAYDVPETTKSPPKTDAPFVKLFLDPIAPETKKEISVTNG